MANFSWPAGLARRLGTVPDRPPPAGIWRQRPCLRKVQSRPFGAADDAWRFAL